MRLGQLMMTMSRSSARARISGPGILPRTKTIHFISTLSAVRTTWGFTRPVSSRAGFLTKASTSLMKSLPQA